MIKRIKDTFLLYSRRKANNSFKKRQFDSEYLDIYALTFLTKYLCSAISLITGFFFVSSLFKGSFENNAIELTVSLILLFMVEILKYYLTPKAFSSILKKRIIEGILFLLISIPLYACSIYFSVSGTQIFFDKSKKIEELYQKDSYSKQDSLISYYDSQIENEQKKLNTIIEYASSKGSLSWKTTTEQIDRLEKRIDRLESNKYVALNKEESQTKDSFEKEYIEQSKVVKMLVRISYATELILLISFMFSQYFLYRTYILNEAFWKPKKTVK